MIEIERKFKLRDVDLKMIKQLAQFRSEKKYNDEYFDNSTHDLTKKDTWLRKRNGKWECKVAMENTSNKGTDYYLEITSEQDILQYLMENKNISRIDSSLSLDDQLVAAGFTKFASISSTRTKYENEKFTLDLDVTDFGYSIGEIEIMVQNVNEIPRAQKVIDEFIAKHGLVVSGVQGKVLEYLSRYRNEHYEALVQAGLISRKIS